MKTSDVQAETDEKNILRGRSTFQLVNKGIAAFLIALPSLVLYGWHIDNEILKRVIPGFVAMNPLTAITFIVTGITLLLLQRKPQTTLFRRIHLLLGVAIGSVGALVLASLLFNLSFQPDRWFFNEKLATIHDPSPNRMAPNTAFVFLVMGITIVFMDSRSRLERHFAHIGACFITFIALVAIIGYLYNQVNWYGVQSYIPMAMHTAICFLVTAVGLGLSRVDEGKLPVFFAIISRFSLETKITVGLIIGLLLLVVVSLVSYVGFERSIQSSQQIRESYQRLRLRDELLLELVNAETGERGYILTGNEQFLEIYFHGASNYRTFMDQLIQKSQSEQELRSLRHIDRLIQQKLNSLQNTIEIRRTRGLAAAQEEIERGAGKTMMDDIRAEIGYIAATEAAQLAQLEEMNRQSIRNARISVVLGNVAAVITVLGGLSLIGSDLRHRHKLQLKLERQKHSIEIARAKDDATLLSIGDGIVVVDMNRYITRVNPRLEEMTGYSAAELLGHRLSEVLPLLDDKGTPLPEEQRPLWHVFKTGKSLNSPVVGSYYNYVRKDGVIFPAALTVSPIIYEKKIVGAILVVRDITVEREVDRMKTEFISLASHQLRTPLSAMRWYLEMLLDGDAGKLNDEQRAFVQNVNISNDQMIGLVNSLLNVSRIESGRIIIEPIPTDVEELIRGVLSEVMVRLKEKKQELIVSIHPKLPKVKTDPRLLRNAIMNLVTNAIKYTPEGGEVSILVSKKNEKILIQISDTGYGIPKSEQPKLYQKFFRASNAIKAETDGNGLGLYLVKAIIASLNGTIQFESEVGHGTTFWIRIPISGLESQSGEVSIDS